MNPLRKHAYLLPAAAAAAVVLLILAARQFAAAGALRREAAPSTGATPAGSISAGTRPVGEVLQTSPSTPPLVITRGMAGCLATGGDGAAPGAKDRFFSEIERRFRLAGFRIDARRPEASRAIIEDRDAHRQWLRRKGEELSPAVTLAEVGTNAVTLSTPYGLYSLRISRREEGQGRAASGAGRLPDAPAPQQLGADAASRLAGHETSPGTWTFSRNDIMAYYDEVRSRPERLEAVFDTLAPIWYTDEADGKQKIEGYRVEPCGEEAFFSAVGFREGDIVREVNGIRMDNRYAAEELIRRFAANDLDFAHIKMERGGEEIIQTYFVE